MATGIPCTNEQASTIKTLLKKTFAEGETWNVIDTVWWNEWKTFVNFDGKTIAADVAPKHPGPIDNSGLLEEGQGEQRLKKGLTKDIDYILLPREGWEKLSAWYNNMDGQQPIFRKVVETLNYPYSRPQDLDVEVYLCETKLCTFPGMGHIVEMDFSKSDTFRDIESQMKKVVDIPTGNEVQIWEISCDGGLERIQAYETQFRSRPIWRRTDNKLLMIEQKLDTGEWPSKTCFEIMKGEQNMLSLHFSKMFTSGDFSDVTIKTEEKSFKAHKAVLASRSRVFKAMFSHDLEEQKNNVVEIVDFESEVVEAMLCFMYTGKLPKIMKVAMELLAAAEKYEIEDLKNMCEKWMIANICLKNVSQTLLTADLYNAQKMEKACIEFIVKHAPEVMKTDKWKSVCDSKVLLVKICTAFASESAMQRAQALRSKVGGNAHNTGDVKLGDY